MGFITTDTISKLPASWTWTRLGDIGIFVNGDRGKNYPSADAFVSDGVPFINAGHLDGRRVDFSNMNYITESAFDALGSGKVCKGDILYCLRGSLGKSALVDFDQQAAIASSLVIIRCSDANDRRYVHHFLTSPLGQKEIHRFNNGSSQPNLSATSVKDYLVPLPPLSEQKRIADILDKADAIRRKRQEAVRTLDDLPGSLFWNWFGDPVANSRGFPLVELNEVISLLGGFAFQSKDYQCDGIPLIRIGNANNGNFSEGSLVYLPEHYADRFARFILNPGDMIVTLTGTVGKDDYANVIEVPNSHDRWFLNQRVAKVTVIDDRVSKHYLIQFLMNSHVKNLLRRMNRGVRQANLRNDDILSQKIPVPPQYLQLEFASAMSKHEKLISNMCSERRISNVLFDSLVQRAFKGEL